MGWGIIGKGIWVSSGSLITLWVTIIRSVTCTLSFVSVLAPPHTPLSFPSVLLYVFIPPRFILFRS